MKRLQIDVPSLRRRNSKERLAARAAWAEKYESESQLAEAYERACVLISTDFDEVVEDFGRRTRTTGISDASLFVSRQAREQLFLIRDSLGELIDQIIRSTHEKSVPPGRR
jgi:hypothetical protein